ELERALEQLSSRERQLEELSQKLDLALDSYQCGIWAATPGKPGAVWDDRMHQLYRIEYADGLVTEEQWLNQVHPDDRAAAAGVGDYYRRPGDSHILEVRVIQPDGGVRYIRSVGKVHEPKVGECKIIGIAFDVTDEALRTAQLKNAKDEAVAKNV